MVFSSSGALDSPSFSFMSTTSFSDLLNSPALDAADAPASTGVTASLSDRIPGRTGVPKFKSLPPPSLPISAPSYFALPPGLSPAELLDSPVLLSSSHVLPSPTTGAITGLGQSLNWKYNTAIISNQPAPIKREDNLYSDFTFQTQHQTSADQFQNRKEEPIHCQNNHQQHQEHQSWGLDEQAKQKNEEVKILPQNQPSECVSDQKNTDDGYNWRKYGQKQVKGSENPRSYYKCTFPGCPTKKKVERALDGIITEIVYKGSHSHPKPTKTRRSSSAMAMAMTAAASGHAIVANSNGNHVDVQESSFGSGQMDTPENSSISIVDDEIDRGSQRSRSGGDDFHDGEQDVNFDGCEREAKRWKGEGESECMSAALGSKTVREPRVVVQTTSEIDILDDGYRWRKYGQKVVKGNPNPRSYYKCTYQGCSVRKHVERAGHDIRSVITTYEGKHNHNIPAARGSTLSTARLPISDNYNPRPQSSSDGRSPLLLEMVQNSAGGFDFSGSYNVDQRLRSQHNMANAKEEPRQDAFFESRW